MEGDPTSDLARAGVVVANRYRLESVLGRGGMGSVWSATHLGLGHQIAIKLISRQLIRSPDALRRFDAEAKAAARLQSRHVVQVYDNGTLDDGTPYIAMEMLTGESLQHRIDQRGPVALAEAIQILSGCCKALGRAHALGIVHRDIKPDNIYLARTPDEEGDVVKVLDFGVAKVAIEGSQGQTGTGMLLGTPLYMSPEQARGLKTLDSRADLYSLGLAAFTMLTGTLAINAESFGEILLKICVEPLPSLCAAAPWLPPSMEGWFQRVCAREPAARCQTSQEFIDSLRIAAGQTPIPQRLSAEGSGPVPLAVLAPTMASVGGSVAQPVKAASVNMSGVNMAISAAGVPKRNSAVLIVASVMATLAIGAVVLLVMLHPQAPAASDASPDTRSAAASSPAPPPQAAPSTAATAVPSGTGLTNAPAASTTPSNAPPIATQASPIATTTNAAPSSRAPAPVSVSTPTRVMASAQPSPVSTKPTPLPSPPPPPAPTHSGGPPVINLGY